MGHNHEEHLDLDYGKPDKKSIAKLIAQGNKMKQPKKDCGCVNKCPHTISNSVGEFVIIVTRNTFNLVQDLPYCLWGSLYIDPPMNYGKVLAEYLPVGIVVSNAINANGDMVFTYNSGIDFDTITVSAHPSSLISYAEMVASIKTNYMNTCFMTYDCNSKDAADTLDNSVILGIQNKPLFLQKMGGTGDKDNQLIIPKSRRQINNSVMNIIELYLRNEPIKPDSVWVHKFAYIAPLNPGIPLVDYEFMFTVFMSNKIDMNAETTKAQ